MDDGMNSAMLQRWVSRWQAGDRAAANELMRASYTRLEKLARKMCRGFPNVREWAETGDVLHNGLWRLLRTLQNMRPATTRDFFNLAAVHIRRELIDLARHYRSRGWLSLDCVRDDDGAGRRPAFQLAAQEPPADLDMWCRFHEAVEELPEDEKETVSLMFYHGWTQLKIAGLLGVDERTVRRRWASACKRLRGLVGDGPL